MYIGLRINNEHDSNKSLKINKEKVMYTPPFVSEKSSSTDIFYLGQILRSSDFSFLLNQNNILKIDLIDYSYK